MTEYLVIVIVVAVAVIIGLRSFGGSVSGSFEEAKEEIGAMKRGGSLSYSSPDNRSEAPPSSAAMLVPPSSDAEAGRSSASGANSDTLAALRPAGVGDREIAISREVPFDWRKLAGIGAVFCLFGVAVVFLKRGGKKKKRKKRSRRENAGGEDHRGEDGQALAEFTLIAITFLFVVLGVMQLALALNAYAMVRYAAYNAARAAIVHGGDEAKMKEAARLSLVAIFPTHGRADHLKGFTENYLAAAATDWMVDLGEGPITSVRILNNKSLDSGHTVLFDDAPESANANITVEVKHYQLVIPLVNRILYYVYTRFLFHGSTAGETLDSLARKTDTLRRGGGELANREYRIPLVAHYTMRLQSDYEVGGGS
jgi:Flp pilus assembly pilin Flp